jgi:two-component system KDP operon response regulator KdpE
VDDLVLIVDRSSIERRYVAAILAADGFHVVQMAGVIEGFIEVMEKDPALIVLAEETEPLQPEEVISVVRRVSSAPVMVLGGGELPAETPSLMSGGDFYLKRPFGPADLAGRARMLTSRRRATPEDRHMRLLEVKSEDRDQKKGGRRAA